MNEFTPRKARLCFLTLLAISLTAGASENMIDDFELNSNIQWSYVSDQVMGGISEGVANFGRDDQGAFAHMKGTVSTANNGGFIQLRTNLPSGAQKESSGVYLKARGNGQKYYIHLRTRGTMLPWQYYQSGFEVSDEWQTIKLPMDSFEASGSWIRKSAKPTSIRSIGIVAYGRDHKADIQVSEIGFYD